MSHATKPSLERARTAFIDTTWNGGTPVFYVHARIDWDGGGQTGYCLPNPDGTGLMFRDETAAEAVRVAFLAERTSR